MQLLPTDTPPRRSRGPLSTKNGTFAVAAILALIAGGALLVFLREYRNDLTGSDPVQVLVASSVVPKGTPGDIIASDQLYRLERVKNSQAEDDAINDPDELEGKVLATQVQPGHQLQSSDFESGRVAQAQLQKYQRAMTVPVDPHRGLIGHVEAGDSVDVIVTRRTLGGTAVTAYIAARDVLVLSVPDDVNSSGVGSSTDQPARIRVSDREAVGVAAGRDGGEVWLVLRPAVDARSHAARVANSLASGGSIKADINVNVNGR
jgi:Flp pilus assembly protein CpaB